MIRSHTLQTLYFCSHVYCLPDFFTLRQFDMSSNFFTLVFSKFSTKATCKLCNVTTYTIQDLAQHLRDEDHEDFLSEFITFKRYGNWLGKNDMSLEEIEMHGESLGIPRPGSSIGNQSMDLNSTISSAHNSSSLTHEATLTSTLNNTQGDITDNEGAYFYTAALE